jgi:hypothetical protein
MTKDNTRAISAFAHFNGKTVSIRDYIMNRSTVQIEQACAFSDQHAVTRYDLACQDTLVQLFIREIAMMHEIVVAQKFSFIGNIATEYVSNHCESKLAVKDLPLLALKPHAHVIAAYRDSTIECAVYTLDNGISYKVSASYHYEYDEHVNMFDLSYLDRRSAVNRFIWFLFDEYGCGELGFGCGERSEVTLAVGR